MDTPIEGFVETVEDGTLYGRVMIDGEEYGIEMPFLDVPDEQRSYIGEGTYFSIINGGYLLPHKYMWKSVEIEEADRKAKRMFKALHRCLEQEKLR